MFWTALERVSECHGRSHIASGPPRSVTAWSTLFVLANSSPAGFSAWALMPPLPSICAHVPESVGSVRFHAANPLLAVAAYRIVPDESNRSWVMLLAAPVNRDRSLGSCGLLMSQRLTVASSAVATTRVSGRTATKVPVV